jgi:hypothetical protein
MSTKRKAAANVFQEQQAATLQGKEFVEQDEVPAAGPLPPAQFAPASPYPAPAEGAQAQPKISPMSQERLKTSEELQLEKEPLRVRETGFWRFKRVIVPPNAYVVHTRLGRKEPVTLGLGVSFHYNPETDAYLIVPAAMQTIGVVANCISQEKQGLNILAYVQWQIHDFAVAYRKLDLSDSRDPLAIVNAQLREQAEAAIKDKIATLSVEEVLTDKAPIIEELTTRLKAVAEGRVQNEPATDEGLGIKIVTVQIKEALVSSQRLWEHLQAPFRYEQEKTARISYLLMQDEIRQKELENRQLAETSEAETMVTIERTKQSKQTEALEVRLTEEARRFTREQETTRQKVRLEEETTRIRRESEARLEAQAAQAQQEASLAALRRAQEEALEQTRLDVEAATRQKALQVEQTLQALAEDTRLAEAKLQADRQQLEPETELKKEEAAFKLLVQEQQDRLKSQALEAELARTRQETMAHLALEEEAHRVKMALSEKEVEIARRQQEVRNLINERDLSGRLIDKLPELAAHMPEVHELKVLQTGQSDGAFEALSLFLAKMLALADSLGLPLTNAKGSE